MTGHVRLPFGIGISIAAKGLQKDEDRYKMGFAHPGLLIFWAVATISYTAFACEAQRPAVLSNQSSAVVDVARKVAQTSALDLGDCTPEKMAQAQAGSICHTPSATWAVVDEQYRGVRVYRDFKSGISVTEPLREKFYETSNFALACKNGYVMPSGAQNHSDNPIGKDDFEILEGDGLRSVVPGVKDHLFWTANTRVMGSLYRYSYDGYLGYVNFAMYTGGAFSPAVRDNVLCVMEP